LLTLAIVTGITSVVVSPARPAGADQISNAKAEAAAISAKLSQDSQELQTLTGEVSAAQYKISQLKDAIAAGQVQLDGDRTQVAKDQGQLRTQAVNEYTHSGSDTQITQMFASDSNTTGIRDEYTTIAAGNVTDTIDTLHTAQVKLQAQQTSLDQQQSQATAAENTVQSAESQTSTLVTQQQSALNGVNSTIATLVAQQQQEEAQAAAAAATAAFNAKLAASRAAQAVQAVQAVQASSGDGSTVSAVASGPLPPLAAGAAGAVQAAETQIGVPYVYGAASPGVGFDCSGLVMWAYDQVGISLPHYSGAQFADTTHIPMADIEPGDLLFYGPGGDEHVAMYVGGGSMIEAPYTGASVWITGVRTDGLAGVGRVV
jgi:cell wall-associated NlpC family hydrolase